MTVIAALVTCIKASTKWNTSLWNYQENPGERRHLVVWFHMLLSNYLALFGQIDVCTNYNFAWLCICTYVVFPPNKSNSIHEKTCLHLLVLAKEIYLFDQWRIGKNCEINTAGFWQGKCVRTNYKFSHEFCLFVVRKSCPHINIL